MDEPIRFVEHHGKQILVVDAVDANAHDILLMLKELQIVVAQHARGSLLTFADFTGA